MIDKPEHNETNTDYKLPEPAAAPKKPKGTGFALFIAFLALFFTAAGIAAGYKHWQRMNVKAKDNAAHISQLADVVSTKADTAALDNLRKDMGDTVAALTEKTGQDLQKVTQMHNQTQQFAETVTAQVEQVTRLQARLQQSATPTTAKEWQVEEVAFLLRLANQELHLTGSKEVALRALKEADNLLGKSGSVTYLPVRQQIIRDIATLEAFAAPDVTGISQKITALMLSLSASPSMELPKTANNPATTDEPAKAESSGDTSIWEQYKQKALDTLNQAVVVHQLDQPIVMELDTEARQSVYQLLQLRLENLRLMALQRQNSNYHQQLGLIGETLKTYYPESKAAPLLAQLQALANIELEPTIPDISASLTQLEKARQTNLAGEQKP